MQDKFAFKYAVIRIVPKVERKEFFNVGVILFCKRKKFLDIRYHISENKLNAFSSDVEAEVFNDHLEAWKVICEGGRAAGVLGQLDLSDRFGWLTAARSTTIQSSCVHSGLAGDPEKALEDIFREHVL